MNFTLCQAKALHLLEGNNNVFLTGAAGTGKSFLLQQYLRGKGWQEYPVLASTGTAALLIEGRTFHSFFGLGILEGGKDATVARALRNGRLHSRLQRAECIIVDEISMLSGEVIATAEEIARHARENNQPWGGLRIVAVGDFAQLPPVQTEDSVKDWGFAHPVWERTQFQSAYLQISVRTNEPRLLRVLNDVREGEVTEEVQLFLQSRIAPSDASFDGTRLFPHRASADRYNMQRLATINQPEKKFQTSYSGGKRYVDQLRKQCPIPEMLHLKVGALVMMRKNDTSFPYAYVNGSLGTVQSIGEDVLHIRLMGGEDVEVDRQTFSLLDGNGSERASAINFPVTLAWATTIHKAQGASIDRLMISMARLWESGHAYVALSRARSEQGLFIERWDAKSIFIDPIVQDFYRHVRAEWEQTASALPNSPPTMSTAPRSRPKKKQKISNHEQTHTLLKERQSLSAIAEALGWKEETIIEHIERLLREGATPDISYLRPSSSLLDPIASAFSEFGTETLKSVFDEFEGKYSYKDLKLVRLFIVSDTHPSYS